MNIFKFCVLGHSPIFEFNLIEKSKMILRQYLSMVAAGAVVLLSGCATIVNDPNIPLSISFSDGSAGECNFKNKRGAWPSEIPATNLMIRRSDDALVYDCTTDDGREATGSIVSEIEDGKMAASVVFWDLGITDSITDKHRTYQGNIVIPVDVQGAVIGEVPEHLEESNPNQEW